MSRERVRNRKPSHVKFASLIALIFLRSPVIFLTSYETTRCPLLLTETPAYRRGTTPTPPIAPSAPSGEPSRVPPLVPRRRPSLALDSLWPTSLTLPTSTGGSGSSEKDADRELAAAAFAAAGKFGSSSSAAAHILGAILKILA